ncbi:hypothetical protein BY996DRAFT_6416573 [Phakopsora pachyrhizi]|nr:hypothetical protein BY996DRAFT_6416573 [Phakopsora pachyrhizi]
MKTNWKCLRWAEFNHRSAGVFATASTPLFGSMQCNFTGGGGNNEYRDSVARTPVGFYSYNQGSYLFNNCFGDHVKEWMIISARGVLNLTMKPAEQRGPPKSLLQVLEIF